MFINKLRKDVVLVKRNKEKKVYSQSSYTKREILVTESDKKNVIRVLDQHNSEDLRCLKNLKARCNALIVPEIHQKIYDDIRYEMDMADLQYHNSCKYCNIDTTYADTLKHIECIEDMWGMFTRKFAIKKKIFDKTIDRWKNVATPTFNAHQGSKKMVLQWTGMKFVPPLIKKCYGEFIFKDDSLLLLKEKMLHKLSWSNINLFASTHVYEIIGTTHDCYYCSDYTTYNELQQAMDNNLPKKQKFLVECQRRKEHVTHHRCIVIDIDITDQDGNKITDENLLREKKLEITKILLNTGLRFSKIWDTKNGIQAIIFFDRLYALHELSMSSYQTIVHAINVLIGEILGEPQWVDSSNTSPTFLYRPAYTFHVKVNADSTFTTPYLCGSEVYHKYEIARSPQSIIRALRRAFKIRGMDKYVEMMKKLSRSLTSEQRIDIVKYEMSSNDIIDAIHDDYIVGKGFKKSQKLLRSKCPAIFPQYGGSYLSYKDAIKAVDSAPLHEIYDIPLNEEVSQFEAPIICNTGSLKQNMMFIADYDKKGHMHTWFKANNGKLFDFVALLSRKLECDTSTAFKTACSCLGIKLLPSQVESIKTINDCNVNHCKQLLSNALDIARQRRDKWFSRNGFMTRKGEKDEKREQLYNDSNKYSAILYAIREYYRKHCRSFPNLYDVKNDCIVIAKEDLYRYISGHKILTRYFPSFNAFVSALYLTALYGYISMNVVNKYDDLKHFTKKPNDIATRKITVIKIHEVNKEDILKKEQKIYECHIRNDVTAKCLGKNCLSISEIMRKYKTGDLRYMLDVDTALVSTTNTDAATKEALLQLSVKHLPTVLNKIKKDLSTKLVYLHGDRTSYHLEIHLNTFCKKLLRYAIQDSMQYKQLLRCSDKKHLESMLGQFIESFLYKDKDIRRLMTEFDVRDFKTRFYESKYIGRYSTQQLLSNAINRTKDMSLCMLYVRRKDQRKSKCVDSNLLLVPMPGKKLTHSCLQTRTAVV